MKTDDLISDLSSDASLRVRVMPTTVIAIATVLAFILVTSISVVWLWIDDDVIARVANNYSVIVNAILIVSIGYVGFIVVRDLSVPGRAVAVPKIALATPFLVIALLAMLEFLTSPLNEVGAQVGHNSWLKCVLQAIMLSAPAFAVLILGVRSLAPTDLRRAGGYVGLLAGAIGSLGYCLHSSDETFIFSLTAFLTGLVSMTLIGAITGPLVLRWR